MEQLSAASPGDRESVWRDQKAISVGVILEGLLVQEDGWFDDVGSAVFGAPCVALATEIAQVAGVTDLMLFRDDELTALTEFPAAKLTALPPVTW